MLVKKLENIFIILAAIFGLIFLFATPYNGVADEETHMMRSCEVTTKFQNNYKIFIIIYITIILIYSSFVLLKYYQYPFSNFIYKIML